ncbi:redoxin domain-containing protein [Mesonia ostreae]|uniref:TlpA disulfide reductase family protein n=1 Tax=Mesonia ostreae TaxID=861110 RepID=A0ABU2KK88_9FLAO|nr:TlpA disulfide reductase family protein [Mesonia ostreae]MDT0295143.1 TlpA disulfide reductase family protein [Mesonia ostreae]
MKKFFVLFLALTALVACENDSKKESGLTAKIDAEDGTTVYYSAMSDQGSPKAIDTVVVKNGEISLELPEVNYQTLSILTLDGNARGNVLFINENKKVEGTIYKDSLQKSHLKGGENQELLYKYLTFIGEQGKKVNELGMQSRDPKVKNDPEMLKSLRDRRAVLTKDENEFREDLIKNNPNSLVSILVLSDMIGMNMNPNADKKALFDSLSEEAKNSPSGKKIEKYLAANQDINIGSKAPSFSAKTPEGNELSLEESLGKITIIDFWASWCKPCRIENPNVVKLYNKYHEKGLNIIGVSLDKKTQKDKWLKAIEDDKLAWQHVSNLEYWNEPIAKLYNVRSIPATFILDEDGNIIAKNLRGKRLEDKIAELLD